MAPPLTKEWLERANRLALTSRLLSSTVHDVNNALQVIAGSVELLQMQPAASEMVQRRIAAIDTQAKRATKLLQDLSDFARDARSAPERFDLTGLALQVLTARHYSLTKARIAATTVGDPVTVMANPRHIQQILLNLVVNAEEAQPSALSIAVGVEGAKAVVTIEDNAPALSRADLGPANLGIGLEVCSWLAELNGGTVVREPSPTGGSRAFLRLPIA
jgi:signal transduction histidine kinase